MQFGKLAKRFAGLVLALAMCLGASVFSVGADLAVDDGVAAVTTLEELEAALANDDVVKIEITEDITIAKELTIEKRVHIVNNAVLNVADDALIEIRGEAARLQVHKGTLNMQGGEINVYEEGGNSMMFFVDDEDDPPIFIYEGGSINLLDFEGETSENEFSFMYSYDSVNYGLQALEHGATNWIIWTGDFVDIAAANDWGVDRLTICVNPDDDVPHDVWEDDDHVNWRVGVFCEFYNGGEYYEYDEVKDEDIYVRNRTNLSETPPESAADFTADVLSDLVEALRFYIELNGIDADEENGEEGLPDLVERFNLNRKGAYEAWGTQLALWQEAALKAKGAATTFADFKKALLDEDDEYPAVITWMGVWWLDPAYDNPADFSVPEGKTARFIPDYWIQLEEATITLGGTIEITSNWDSDDKYYYEGAWPWHGGENSVTLEYEGGNIVHKFVGGPKNGKTETDAFYDGSGWLAKTPGGDEIEVGTYYWVGYDKVTENGIVGGQLWLLVITEEEAGDGNGWYYEVKDVYVVNGPPVTGEIFDWFARWFDGYWFYWPSWDDDDEAEEYAEYTRYRWGYDEDTDEWKLIEVEEGDDTYVDSCVKIVWSETPGKDLDGNTIANAGLIADLRRVYDRLTKNEDGEPYGEGDYLYGMIAGYKLTAAYTAWGAALAAKEAALAAAIDERDNATVTVSRTAGGTAVVKATAAEGAGGASVKVAKGTSVTATAKASEGFEFAGWFAGDVKKSALATYTFNADATIELVAKFTEIEPELSGVAPYEPRYVPVTVMPPTPTVKPARHVMKPIHKPGEVVSPTITNDTLILGGTPTVFPAYKIGGYNWLKLRDIAALLNGTNKEFSLEYDAETNTVIITTGKAYTPLGDELQALPADIKAVASPQNFIIDGVEISIAAYNINGYNYFRLADLAILLNFYVEYNDADGSITMDLDKDYE